MKEIQNEPRLCDELNHWKAVIVTAGTKFAVHEAGMVTVEDGAVDVVIWHQPSGSLATSGRRRIKVDWSLNMFKVIILCLNSDRD